MTVYDAFIFYNELDLLEARLIELDPVVDYFVLVEATKTFSGNPKPLFFKENRHRYHKYLDKIRHVIIDDMPDGPDVSAWTREFHQRNCMTRGLTDVQDSDIVLFNDLDEIPHHQVIQQVTHPVMTLEMPYYYYSLQYALDMMCYAGKISTGQGYHKIKHDLHAARVNLNVPTIHGAGCHYSYFMSPEQVSIKLKSFAHTEFSGERYTNVEHLRKQMIQGKDILLRFQDNPFQGVNPREDPLFLKFRPETQNFLLEKFGNIPENSS